MRFKLLFLFFILFTFLVNSQPSRGLDLSFNPEAIGFKTVVDSTVQLVNKQL